MRVIAINDGHNASCVLLEDGRIVAAIQEERLTRVKNQDGFPQNALDWILKSKELAARDVDAYVITSRYVPINIGGKTRDDRIRNYKHNALVRSKFKALLKEMGAKRIITRWTAYRRIQPLLNRGITRERMSFVEHHKCHAVSAYLGWGLPDKDVLVLTNDGAGDDLCATVSVGKGGKIIRIASVHMDDSIGELWALITAIMGMVPLEHEYKLMGLAPYAPASGRDRVKALFAECFEFVDEGMTWRRKPRIPPIPRAYEYFRKKLEFMRFDWICAGLQEFTEEFLTTWVRNAIRETGIDRVALAGGTFLNVKANKRIGELPEVKDLFVFPSCGDETLPFGAGYAEFAKRSGRRNVPLEGLYLGPRYSTADVEKMLSTFRFAHEVKVERIDDIAAIGAQLLADGEVVAWFQGAEEFGARALGGRSILADPTKKDVVKIINEMIKSRDFWMPFASSLLPEGAQRYLINPKDLKSEYMILTFDTTEAGCELEGGRHPFDHTCRPQVVREDWHPTFYLLLKRFQAKTGRAGILNTSFNLHGYPIVSSPEDAFDVFDKSGLRFLVIEEFLIEKVRLT